MLEGEGWKAGNINLAVINLKLCIIIYSSWVVLLYKKKYASVDCGFLGNSAPEYNICSEIHLVFCRSGKASREYNELAYH